MNDVIYGFMCGAISHMLVEFVWDISKLFFGPTIKYLFAER